MIRDQLTKKNKILIKNTKLIVLITNFVISIGFFNLFDYFIHCRVLMHYKILIEQKIFLFSMNESHLHEITHFH